MEINLGSEKTIIVKPIEKTDVTIINLLGIFDMPDNKTVKAYIKLDENHQIDIILWEGDDYDLIKDWTKQDVIARIKELLS